MNRLNRSQRDKLQQFVSISGASDKTALSALRASDWNLEGAFDYFYSSSFSNHSQPSINTRQLEDLWMKYKDPEIDMILAEGISKFCDDIQVDPQDIVILVLCWHLKASTMCEFSHSEFFDGLKSLGVDSIEKIKNILPNLKAEIRDEQKFREIYHYAFDWAKEKGQKSLALDIAIGMWNLIFSTKKWIYLQHWCEFLQAKHNKSISRDTWFQLIDFSRLADTSLSNYDAEGAWPYLIDEFVEYLRENNLIISK